MLLMKKVFFEAIRSGGKTTTLRYWRRRQVRPGSLQTIRGLGKVRIDEAACVKFTDLTDADAQADGLADLQALRTALRDFVSPRPAQRTKALPGAIHLGGRRKMS